MTKILITTQDNFSEHTIEKTIGLVRGNTVRSRNIVRNIIANLRTIIGGEITEITKAVEDSRQQALDRLIAHATALNADGIVCLRFVTSEAGQSCSEILAYGTAVTFKK